MSNPISYKNIDGQSFNIDFVYEPGINLCDGKCVESGLRVIVLDSSFTKQESFFTGSYEFALEKNITQEEADARLIDAANLFNESKNIDSLKENSEIMSLLNKVDLFLNSNKNLSIISNYNDYLKNIGWELFDLLDQYIKLHDSIFNWRNIFKTSKFFYKKISWLTIVFVKIKSIENRMKEFTENHNLDNESRDYINCLLNYIKSLNEAIALLQEWLRMMGDSRSSDKKAYSKDEIDQIYNKYGIAQKEYVKIGWKLKLLYEKL